MISNVHLTVLSNTTLDMVVNVNTQHHDVTTNDTSTILDRTNNFAAYNPT